MDQKAISVSSFVMSHLCASHITSTVQSCQEFMSMLLSLCLNVVTVFISVLLKYGFLLVPLA
jgi:hypothetical protein